MSSSHISALSFIQPVLPLGTCYVASRGIRVKNKTQFFPSRNFRLPQKGRHQVGNYVSKYLVIS